MSNGEHEIRTPKGLRIGNRSVVDGKNMLQIKRGGCEDYISAESLVECIEIHCKSDRCISAGGRVAGGWGLRGKLVSGASGRVCSPGTLR